MRLNNETKTCESDQGRITALLDNELAPADAAYLRNHLALCPDCTQVFDQTRKTLQAADAWKVDGSDIWQAIEKRLAAEPAIMERVEAASQNDIHAVLTEMRALRTEIQELRGEVGTLRRLLSVTQQASRKPAKRSLPPEWMPSALPENNTIGLL